MGFAMDVLRNVPMAVLYGVFLYMGVAALAGNQFWERILMLLMQPSKYPARPHTQRISRGAMHKKTLLQLLVFASLYAVKTIKSIAIAFPLIIAACIPLRKYVLPRLFSSDELLFL